jgi:hypothetical protein
VLGGTLGLAKGEPHVVLVVVSTVAIWRVRAEHGKDAASVAYLKSTRASENEGWRRFAAAKRDRTYGTEH